MESGNRRNTQIWRCRRPFSTVQIHTTDPGTGSEPEPEKTPQANRRVAAKQLAEPLDGRGKKLCSRARARVSGGRPRTTVAANPERRVPVAMGIPRKREVSGRVHAGRARGSASCVTAQSAWLGSPGLAHAVSRPNKGPFTCALFGRPQRRDRRQALRKRREALVARSRVS